MNSFVVLLGLCEVMIVHVHEAHCQKNSLDEYCFYELPEVKRENPGYLSMLKLVYVCSDMDVYTNCLKSTRGRNDLNDDVKFQEFEKHFPPVDDMERAGFTFCWLSLLSDPYLYNVSPRKVTACKSKVNEAKCEFAIEEDSRWLKIAAGEKKPDLITYYGCRAYTSYWTCMRNQYTACNPETEPLFDYYLARAGVSCLQKRKIFNRVLFTIECVTQPPNSTCPSLDTMTESTTQQQNDVGDSGGESPLLVLGMTCAALTVKHRGPYDSPFEN